MYLTAELREIYVARICSARTKIKFTVLGIQPMIITQEKKQERVTFKE